MKRAIVAFERDAEGHWVARLACGHSQHVRHDPPLTSRPLVLTERGRAQLVGVALECKLCEEEREAGMRSV